MSEPLFAITDHTFPDLAEEKAAAVKAGAKFVPRQCGSGEEVEAALSGAIAMTNAASTDT